MLRIASVEPTILFTGGENGLLQTVRLTIENRSDARAAGAELTFKFPGRDPFECKLGDVGPGETTHRVKVPDVRDPAEVGLELRTADGVADQRTVTWQPRKHWQVHLIPIAHHDYGYTGTIEHVLNFYCDLYRDVIRFCAATDDWADEAKFRYTCEGAWSLRHFVAHSSDETIDQLARYVAEGRVEIPALIGNETSGLCGHEELVRLTYPSQRLRRRLGGVIRTGSITDVPGLSWGLPTVLAGAGVNYFFAGLPPYFSGPEGSHTSWDEAAVVRPHGAPDAFWWEGPDGSRVLVYYQSSYGCWSPQSCDDVLEQLPVMLNAVDRKGSPFSVARYGGYGCGDNTPTSIVVSEVVRDWNRRWAFPKLIVSTNTMFFETLEPQCQDLRTFRGELPHTDYAVGAVSSARETSLNRVMHDRLPAAERFAAIASVDDRGVAQTDLIEQAYTDMLMFDEHTWGGWCPVGHEQDFSWHDKSAHAYRAAGLTTAVSRKGLQTLARSVRHEDEGHHVVVFNPLTFARTDIVRVNGLDCANLMYVNEFRPDREAFDLIDVETGRTIPHQVMEITSPQAPLPHAAGRYAMGTLQPTLRRELLFKAEDVPSVGYKTYRIVPADKPQAFSTDVTVTDGAIENQFFKVTVNPETGVVESVYDKQRSRQLVDAGAAHHVNQLVVRKVESGEFETPAKATVRKGEEGTVFGSLVVTSQAFGCPQITQEIVLYDGIKRIDFNNRVLKDSTPLLELYFAFPFKIDQPDVMFEGSHSVIKPFRDQFPGSNTNYYSVQHWADVSDGRMGITFVPIDAHLVEFGGLWPFHVSPAHRNVEPVDFKDGFAKESDLTKGHLYSFVLASNFCTNFRPAQQGDLLFRYSLTTHHGDWKAGRARDFGWARANPFLPVLEIGGRQTGVPSPDDTALSAMASRRFRPTSASFCQIDQPNVVLTTLKRAEDGDGFIIRLIETEGDQTDAAVQLPFLDIAEAFHTNLVEENQGPLKCEPHRVTVSLRPFGIVTVRLRT